MTASPTRIDSRIAAADAVDQPARPAVHAEARRIRRQRVAERVHEPRAPGQADQRVGLVDLEHRRQPGLIEALQAGGVDPQRLRGIRRKAAGTKSGQAGQGQSFRTADLEPGAGLAIPPGGAGARVEQDADHRQVDQCPRCCLAIAAVQLEQLPAQRSVAIDAGGFEVAPAAVVGHGQVGIAAPRDLRHLVGRIRKPRRIEGEVRGFAGTHRGQHLAAAGPDQRGRAQAGKHLRQALGTPPAGVAIGGRGAWAGATGRARCFRIHYLRISHPTGVPWYWPASPRPALRPG